MKFNNIDERKLYSVINKELFDELDKEYWDKRMEIIGYEVYTDCAISGEWIYDPYFLLIDENFKSNQKANKKLKLIITFFRYPRENIISPQTATKKEQFYHGGHIENEIVTLASLFLRKRFELGPMIFMGNKDVIARPIKKQIKTPNNEDKTKNIPAPEIITINNPLIDPEIVEKTNNLNELTEWFKLLEKLDPKYHLKFMLAVRMYYQALFQIEKEPDLAYLNLVSAIEVLCQDTNIGEIKLTEINQKLAKLLESIDNVQLRNDIEKSILKEKKFIARKFSKFILNNIENNFWNEPNRPNTGRITHEELPDLLMKIYQQRSRTLHSGELFPPFKTMMRFVPREEINKRAVWCLDRIQWYPKDLIPYPQFFEKLVNHVLKTFLRRNQLKKDI